MSLFPADDRKRIRVLRIVARLNVGGPALHTVLLTERLDPERYDCRLVAGSPAADEGDYLELRGRSLDSMIRVPSLGREVNLASDFATLRRLIALMRDFRPGIVHTHTAKAGALGRVAAAITGVPVVLHTFHGHVLEGYFSPLKTRFFLEVERRLARRTDRILTVSESVRAELLRLGIGEPSRVAVLPLGLELERFASAASRRGDLRQELGVPTEAPLVGIVARLVPIKAHEVFLEAAAQIVGRIPGCRFVVVGDGERRAELEAATKRLGLSDRVAFLGWRADLERIYADLDVVALTSRNEGSPVALIESMAAGRAVVSTRAGGVPDLVEDGRNGLLVEVGDAKGLADGIVRLLLDRAQREALGEAGRRSVVERYSAERLVADMEALYEELVARSGSIEPRPARASPSPSGSRSGSRAVGSQAIPAAEQT